MLNKLRRNRKGSSIGVLMFLGVILMNIFMYIIIYTANADPLINQRLGSTNSLQYKLNSTSDADLDSTKLTSWYSGFRISVFDLPWWIDVFYVTFQGILLALAIYALIRGL